MPGDPSTLTAFDTDDHGAAIFWLYGRSGAGKTTLATRLETSLRRRRLACFLLDGDQLRHGLCSDLGFDDAARDENHRRAAEMARLIAARGIIVIAATMAPRNSQREIITGVLRDHLRWVYVDATLSTCARRDPKGLYARAAAGKISSLKEYPFDPPRSNEVDLHLDTETDTPDDCHQRLLNYALAELASPTI